MWVLEADIEQLAEKAMKEWREMNDDKLPDCEEHGHRLPCPVCNEDFEISIQARICPICIDDHSENRECKISDLKDRISSLNKEVFNLKIDLDREKFSHQNAFNHWQLAMDAKVILEAELKRIREDLDDRAMDARFNDRG